MGASKTKQHTKETLNLARITRGISHPARILTLQIVRKRHSVRSVDLCPELDLCHSTISGHLLKMKEAGIVDLSFEMNSYRITLVPEALEDLKRYLEDS